MNFWVVLSEYSFLQNAVLAGILSSIICGITGTFVVIKKINFISGGIAHSVLGGVGIAYFFNIDPIIGAFVSAIFAALVIGVIKLKAQQHEDIVISALWAVGMAIGVIFMHLTPGYNADLMSYLFGNILMVSQTDLTLLYFLLGIISIVFFVFYRQFIAISFDEEFSRLRGLPVTFLYLLLLVLIALSIVVLIQIVGLILVIALLTLPAAISGLFTRKVSTMIFLAVLLGIFFTTGGIFISYQPNLPTGATIIILSGITYLVAVIGKSIAKK